MIGIIDYGRGNLRSVEKGLTQVGFASRILTAPSELDEVQGVILPGVGAFADAMHSLNERGWVWPLREYAGSGQPLLGICLGMQVLFEVGEEHGEHYGLGLLPGRVVKFPPGRKVPHMGWNELQLEQSDSLLKEIPPEAYFYFVHSYYVQPAAHSAMNRKGSMDRTGNSIVLATSDYGGKFPAVVGVGNVWGVQFHPEKSGTWGLKLLGNFGERVSEYADITGD